MSSYQGGMFVPDGKRRVESVTRKARMLEIMKAPSWSPEFPWEEPEGKGVATAWNQPYATHTESQALVKKVLHPPHGFSVIANAAGGEQIRMALRCLAYDGLWEVHLPSTITVYEDLESPTPVIAYTNGAHTVFLDDDVDFLTQ